MQIDTAASADAFLAWWALAGVDCAIAETPVNWLRPASSAAIVCPADAAAAEQPAAKAKTINAFHAWLADDATLLEARWSDRRILPVGQANASLMVVTDLPDPADMSAGQLLSDSAGTLFGAMLRAIGIARADIYLASLALTRPPGGMLDAQDMEALATRMRTQIALAAPRRLLLLGDRTIRALWPTDGGAAATSLRAFNHDGGTVPAVATFHPRLLLQQPAAKAECWRTLQSLIEEKTQ
jgi:DNA polymerase